MDALSPASTAAGIVAHLATLASQENRDGMARFGIRVERALGIPHPVQRAIARRIGRDHARAFDLWASGITEARFIAALTADPKRFTPADARAWAAEFDSWDLVDGVSALFVETDHWKELIAEFAGDGREFVRRTAFAMIAWSAVHRRQEPDATFLDLLPIVAHHAGDARNFVWKAVSWALRSIGKRSPGLNRAALELAARLAAADDGTSRRIGRAALKELSSEAVAARLERIAARSRA